MTKSTIALLFPGQGSQSVGMGKELAANYPVARQTFEEADDALRYKLSQLCFDGPEEKLKLTEITQPAILTASIAAYRVLIERGPKPAFVAGHSLGEYSAHVAAGTLKFTDAVRAVRNRGQYMQEAVPVGVGAMAAILGLPLDQVVEICRESAREQVCQPANLNSPEQVVISGHAHAVAHAIKLAIDRGAKKAVSLPVSAPFHCTLMQPAQDRMASDLKAVNFQNPACPVICNVDAAPVTEAAPARDALIRQVTGAVKWDPSIRLLIGKGVNLFVEVGPGKVLWGLMRQIDRSKTCLTVGDEASLQKTLSQFSDTSN
ncbi:MAG TPA: ACP S-malonyltransferase [Terriglobales bacterium]|jgi:[acyl-carrier-protein] S-malonyltransferase|nr:ACP S-malonyltransferase [Terriglobales bacterium]